MPKRMRSIQCAHCVSITQNGLWSKVTVIQVDYWSCDTGLKQTLPFMFSSWL